MLTSHSSAVVCTHPCTHCGREYAQVHCYTDKIQRLKHETQTVSDALITTLMGSTLIGVFYKLLAEDGLKEEYLFICRKCLDGLVAVYPNVSRVCVPWFFPEGKLKSALIGGYYAALTKTCDEDVEVKAGTFQFQANRAEASGAPRRSCIVSSSYPSTSTGNMVGQNRTSVIMTTGRPHAQTLEEFEWATIRRQQEMEIEPTSEVISTTNTLAPLDGMTQENPESSTPVSSTMAVAPWIEDSQMELESPPRRVNSFFDDKETSKYFKAVELPASLKGKWNCNIQHCGQAFDYPEDLCAHTIIMHSKRNEQGHFICTIAEECKSQPVTNSYLLRNHVLRHFQPIRFECLECEFRSYNEAGMRHHITSMHLNPAKKG